VTQPRHDWQRRAWRLDSGVAGDIVNLGTFDVGASMLLLLVAYFDDFIYFV
jgi:hypothetical protein